MPLPTPEEFRDRTKTNAQMREMMAQLAESAESKDSATTKANAAEANAKDYVNSKIKKLAISRNLVNPAEIKTGYTLNASGNEIALSNFNVSGFIEAKPNEIYTKSSSTGVWCEYDNSNQLVKYTTNAQTIITQQDTAFLRCSVITTSILALVQSGVIGEIDEYSEVETVGSVSETLNLIQPHLIDTINAAKLTSDNLDFLKRDSVNLFDSAHLITDKRFVLSTTPNVYAALTTNTFFNTSKLIPIEPSTEYKHSGCGKWVQYDEDMNVVASRSSDFYVVFEFTSDANAKYFQFDFAKTQSNGSNIIFSKKSEYPASYVPYQRYIIDNGIAFDNPWRNKNVLWLGTSIPTGGGYPENVSKNMWANLNKQSGNGGRARAFKSDGSWFAQSNFGFQFTLSKADINTRYGAMLGKTVRANDYLVEDANGVVLTQAMLDALTSSNYEARLLPHIPSTDLFMIDFGINDRNGQLPNISAAFKTCEELEALGKLYDRSEYVGGMNFLIKQIIDAKQAASMNNFQIVIVSHYTRSERHTGTNNVVKAQENIAKYWGIPFINLADNAGVNTLNINLLTNNSDGLHFSANSVIEKRVTRFITSRLKELAM